MNEYNYNKEEPDQHWEGFKKMLYWIATFIIAGTILALKYCK